MLIRKSIAAAVVALLCATSSRAHAQFQPGEFSTWSQESWGDDLNNSAASQLLVNKLNTVYPFGGFEVGVPGLGGHSMIFTETSATLAYLPTAGVPSTLNSDLLNPTSSSSGIFGGLVTALQLNVDFSDAGVLAGSRGIPFGDLTLVAMHDVHNRTELSGLTVREFLNEASISLGGGSGSFPYTADEFAQLTDLVSLAFEGGTPSQFAQDHLRIVPEPAAGALALLALTAAALGRRRRSL